MENLTQGISFAFVRNGNMTIADVGSDSDVFFCVGRPDGSEESHGRN
jgi:hypothetical protein